MVDLRTAYKRKDAIATTQMDGETVMMDVDQGKYFGVSGSGSLLWDLLEEAQHVDELTARMCAAYDVEPNVARADVEAFLALLLDKQLIQEV